MTEEEWERAFADLRQAESFSYAVARLHDDDETYQLCRLVYGDGSEKTGVVALVKRLVAAARADERERAAKVAESTDLESVYRIDGDGGSYWDSDAEKTRDAIARRIREATP